jgi:hypothetical protein
MRQNQEMIRKVKRYVGKVTIENRGGKVSMTVHERPKVRAYAKFWTIRGDGGIKLLMRARSFYALAFTAAAATVYSAVNVLPDKLYHPITYVDGRYKDKADKDAVSLVSMFIKPHGWGAFYPGEKGAKNYRKVEFYKAFLEFNEKGDAFDPNQEKAILSKLDALKSDNRPIYVAAYIHGWHHNANDTLLNEIERPNSGANAIKFNSFVARYAEMTRRLYEIKGDKATPVVLGIYIGWRGEALNGPLSLLTIGNRAAAADRIAQSSAASSPHRVLNTVAAKMRETHTDSRMLIFGHSLGGRLLSRLFLPDIARGHDFPLGKGVLLAAIEPAIGADCYDTFFAPYRKGIADQVPGFISMTSADDSAVGKWYPLSRLVLPISPPACNNNSRARVRTIGNHMNYLTHRVTYTHFTDTEYKKTPKRNPFKADKKALLYPLIDDNKEWLVTEGMTFWRYPYYSIKDRSYDTVDAQYYTMRLSRRDAFSRASSVWNLQTDRNMIDTALDSKKRNGDHNGYVSTNLANFLVHMTYLQKVWTLPEPQVVVPPADTSAAE